MSYKTYIIDTRKCLVTITVFFLNNNHILEEKKNVTYYSKPTFNCLAILIFVNYICEVRVYNIVITYSMIP